jgi:hypothetical protein
MGQGMLQLQYRCQLCVSKGKGQGKVHPIRGHEGPEVE